MKIGNDPGKYGTKVVTKVNGEWKKLYIRSKISTEPDNVLMGDNYLINYKGITYLIGEGGNDYSLDTDKQSLQHKLCTYVGVDEMAGDELSSIVVGCPMSIWKNPEKREEYQNYILDDGKIDLSIGDISKTIELLDVVAFPECGGVAYAEPEEDFVDNIRGVIDIGGLNVNGCLFENLSPIKDSDFTVNLGSIILKNEIKTMLNKEYPSINLQEYDIPQIMKKGLFIKGKEEERAKKLINNVINGHIERIIRETKKKNWSINTLDITMAGGGTIDIGMKRIKSHIPQAKISNDPIWDNAKGNYIVAQILF